MNKVYLISRISRYDKRYIVAYNTMEMAIEERARLQQLYPTANYVIDEVDFKA